MNDDNTNDFSLACIPHRYNSVKFTQEKLVPCPLCIIYYPFCKLYWNISNDYTKTYVCLMNVLVV